MSRDTFISLCNWLVNHTQLRASTHVSVELKLAIFLHIVSRPASQRDTMERYFVGNRIVSESFHEVLESLLILYPAVVNFPDLDTPLASRISDDSRFYPWFKDCLITIFVLRERNDVYEKTISILLLSKGSNG
ncbi:hypothetical protein V1519DRAFT_120513 [Lipomyces tetrasporus]